VFSQAISGESVIDCFFRNASCANLVATGFLRNDMDLGLPSGNPCTERGLGFSPTTRER